MDAYLSEDENDSILAIYTQEPTRFGNIISQYRSSGIHMYHTDALGSTRALTGSNLVTSDTYIYDAWGNPVSCTGSSVNPFRWVGNVGYYFDAVTGLYYIRARTYQPTIARWTSVDPLLAWLALQGTFRSRDPIGYQGSEWGLYEFLSGNSVSRVDPLGLANFVFEPNPWNSPIPWQSTTFGAPYQTGYRGLTIPDEGSIQCKCIGGDGSFKLQCDITIKISKILINKNELNKEMTYNHEMLHVKNYHELGKHYKGILEDLENENRFCGSSDCESFKNGVKLPTKS